MDWITIPITAELLRGALDLERTDAVCCRTGCPRGPAPSAPTATGGDTLTIDMTTEASEHRPSPVGTFRFTDLPGGL
ncbi:hypothetical protein HNP84_005779 [Thermocatellispora tengchongensis]|uniref:Uncharacterized protein n=1 Tax=Thermocatellispora tengchongensis TaxID=1073253 RepID=A0A840PIY6_9ACTN|nr:hypothetical protein [Thermocatellispora tengchongensis]